VKPTAALRRLGRRLALDRSEDVIRWNALDARCKEARGARGIRDMSIITGIPQYRLRAIDDAR